jgi:SAM-dependent methyltransferase
MDEVAAYNVARWRALAEAGALFTRPLLDLDAESARAWLDPAGRLGEPAGKRVLCLAGGGGRESAAFALLGARVTVFDLSGEQLERDRLAAAHYGHEVETVRGDMRDLSALPAGGFDLVWHPYSLNFVPDARAVFREVARVVSPGGLYRLMCANPLALGAGAEDWDGAGYALKHVYEGGAVVRSADEPWVYDRDQEAGPAVPPPREYRHTWETLTGGLVSQGFLILHVAEDVSLDPDPQAAPGTWDHFVAHVPPWLEFVCAYRPDVFE